MGGKIGFISSVNSVKSFGVLTMAVRLTGPDRKEQYD